VRSIGGTGYWCYGRNEKSWGRLQQKHSLKRKGGGTSGTHNIKFHRSGKKHVGESRKRGGGGCYHQGEEKKVKARKKKKGRGKGGENSLSGVENNHGIGSSVQIKK